MRTMQLEAVVSAINIENRTLGFYRAATAKVSNAGTRQIFELLAKEESEQLDSLCKLFHGNEDDLSKILSENNVESDPHYCSLISTIDRDSSGFEALRIALNEEQACMEWYNVFVDLLRAPHVKDVFVRILNETGKQCEMISEAYVRMMNPEGRTDRNSIECQ